MSKLYITEYSEIARDITANLLPLPKEPPVAEQVIDIGPSSVQSNNLHENTRFVRLNAAANCSIAIGDNPTATNNSRRISANSTVFFSIPTDTAVSIAVISNTA